jgi:SAM-dependent methyltransferase
MEPLGRTLYVDSTDCHTGLCTLGADMNTDKSPYAMNSVCCKHRKGYTAVYELLFSQYKNSSIHFAEIGIEAGASILMWNKYFSENCSIYGFEFYKQKIQNVRQFNLKNVKFVHTNVDDVPYLDTSFKNTGVLFDIIIDDSSHENKHQNNIIQTVHKYLKPGGTLIIEDIYRDQHINDFNIDQSIWSFYSFIVCHHKNRFCSDNDKLLYLIKK